MKKPTKKQILGSLEKCVAYLEKLHLNDGRIDYRIADEAREVLNNSKRRSK